MEIKYILLCKSLYSAELREVFEHFQSSIRRSHFLLVNAKWTKRVLIEFKIANHNHFS